MANSSLTEVMSYPFNVDSAQRTPPSINEAPTFTTAQVINLLAKKGVFQLYFTSIQIPFVFYQFTNLVNTSLAYIPLTVTLSDGTNSRTNIVIQVPQGNYSAYTIITALQSTLLAAWVSPLLGTPVFTSTYNPNTGYITYSMTNAGYVNSSVTIYFGTPTSYQYIGGYFGFPVASTTITFNANGTSATSTQPCVLNPINYLLVRSTLKQQRGREFITTADQSSTIVVKIPITTQQQSWINYFQLTEPIFLLDNSISSINFSLTTNISSSVINLQNINWSFSFIIREVIRPDYDSILTTTANNLIVPMNQVNEEDVNRLKEEREQLMGRLELYRKKLEKLGQKGSPVESEEESKGEGESAANLQKARPWYTDEPTPIPSVLHRNKKKNEAPSSDVLPDTNGKVRPNLQPKTA